MPPGGCTPPVRATTRWRPTSGSMYGTPSIPCCAQIKVLQIALVSRAEAEAETIMPGFTHLQSAQPVTLGHHLLAYVEMLGRDAGRFADARTRLNESPLGSAALAGTPYPIDRGMTATALGFDRPTANSLDAVSDRDFVLETLSAASHLRRAPQPLRRGTGDLEFGAVRLRQAQRQVHHRLVDHAAKAQSGCRRAGARQDRPHPRRAHLAAGGDEGPAARLFQGHAGRQGSRLRRARFAQPVAGGDDRHGGRPDGQPGTHAGCGRMPDFPPPPMSPTGWCRRPTSRSARRTTSPGRSWRWPNSGACGLDGLTIEDFKSIDQRIDSRIHKVLSVEASVRSRKSYGGTAPDNVLAQAARWREVLTGETVAPRRAKSSGGHGDGGIE